MRYKKFKCLLKAEGVDDILICHICLMGATKNMKYEVAFSSERFQFEVLLK